MVNQSSPTGDQDDLALPAAQAELLQAVLTAESYPWQPADVTAEYAEQLETAGQALEISHEDAAEAWAGLSQQLDGLWGDRPSETTGAIAPLQQKFAGRLPAALIAVIGEKARAVVSSGQPMAGQMIACVKSQLANIAEADLQVMARPMAMAMRGNSAEEFVEATVRSVRQADWSALSPIEQARLSLAVARYAIAQAEASADLSDTDLSE